MQPQIVVLDVAMDGGEGFTLLKELPRWAPDARVVVFTALEDALSVQRAFQAGAWAYLNRRDPAEALVTAIHGVILGERQIGPRALSLLLERLARGAMELRGVEEAALSERELHLSDDRCRALFAGDGGGTPIGSENGGDAPAADAGKTRSFQRGGVAAQGDHFHSLGGMK